MKSNYKRFQTWCPKCDKVMVEVGKKCSECGSRFKAPKLNIKIRSKNEIEESRSSAYKYKF
jgi:tRNA(Ile2) C34 agmatinyltransferase TiaS